MGSCVLSLTLGKRRVAGNVDDSCLDWFLRFLLRFSSFVCLLLLFLLLCLFKGWKSNGAAGCRVRLGKPQLAPAGPRLRFADSALVEEGDDDEVGQVSILFTPCSY